MDSSPRDPKEGPRDHEYPTGDELRQKGPVQKWSRVRFRCNDEDPRPVTFPPPGPFWITGYGDDYATVVAYFPGAVSVNDVLAYWPEADDMDFSGHDEVTYTDRFPKPEWWTEGDEAEPPNCPNHGKPCTWDCEMECYLQDAEYEVNPSSEPALMQVDDDGRTWWLADRLRPEAEPVQGDDDWDDIPDALEMLRPQGLLTNRSAAFDKVQRFVRARLRSTVGEDDSVALCAMRRWKPGMPVHVEDGCAWCELMAERLGMARWSEHLVGDAEPREDGEIREALARLLKAAESVEVFVQTRERINHPTGLHWWRDELKAARTALRALASTDTDGGA